MSLLQLHPISHPKFLNYYFITSLICVTNAQWISIIMFTLCLRDSTFWNFKYLKIG